MPAVPRPAKRAKKPLTTLLRTAIKRGGKAPRKAGIRQEGQFRDKYEGFTRVVGSGAFGGFDPLLQGDIKGQIGRVKFLLEMKAWSTVNGRGEKTINVPLVVLDKIRVEAASEMPPRHTGVIFHPMNTSRWIAIFDWDEFYGILREQEDYILRLENELERLGG